MSAAETTRRTLLGVGPALAMLGVPLSALAAPRAMDLWRRRELIRAHINQGGRTDEEARPLCDAQYDCEDALIEAPIANAEDAIAVLLLVGAGVETGERCDGLDVVAYRRVVAWLGAH